jgi:hypothetical protein
MEVIEYGPGSDMWATDGGQAVNILSWTTARRPEWRSVTWKFSARADDGYG